MPRKKKQEPSDITDHHNAYEAAMAADADYSAPAAYLAQAKLAALSVWNNPVSHPHRGLAATVFHRHLRNVLAAERVEQLSEDYSVVANPANSWEDVEDRIQDAITLGWLVDYRGKLPTHPTKKFRLRKTPADVCGIATHHSASPNQDIVKTARYHKGPNHISVTGCPGLVYSLAISQTLEPTKVILCNDLASQTWSQGKRGDDDHPEWSADENRHLVAVLVMGDFSDSAVGHIGKSGNPTPSQIARWSRLADWLGRTFGFDGGGHFGHYHFGKASCPGEELRKLIESRRSSSPSLLITDRDWQEALLRWNPACLPKFGADNDWGTESKRALASFERAHTHRVDGIRDPFIELLLAKKYAFGSAAEDLV